MVKYFFCLLFCILSFSLNVYSVEPQKKEEVFVVKDKIKKETDEILWDRLFSLGFNMAKGNTDNSVWNIALKMKKDIENDIKSLDVSANYGEIDDKKTSEKIDGTFEEKYLIGPKKKWFLSSGLQFFHDDIAEIDYRISLNPAVGFFFIKNEKTSFSTELGPSYIFEKVEKKENDYLAPRIAQRLELTLTDTTKFYQFSEANISVENSKDCKVNTEVGLDLAINSKLSVTLTVKDKYDNMPASDAKKNDVEYITSLTSRF